VACKTELQMFVYKCVIVVLLFVGCREADETWLFVDCCPSTCRVLEGRRLMTLESQRIYDLLVHPLRRGLISLYYKLL